MSTRVFETRLAASHPVLRDHRVFGKAVLPGLAYVDLLYQLAAMGLGVDHRHCALRNLTLFAPIALDDGAAVDLRLRFAEVDAGWDIEVAAAGGTRFATAQLRREAIAHTASIDLAQLVGTADRVIGMEQIYAAARERGLVHSGLMRAQGEIHQLGRDRLVRLVANDDGADARLAFHPALIDGAAMATESLRATGDDRLYLPLRYDAFTCSAPLGTACWALIRGDSVRSANDIHTLDIAFYDDGGQQVAALAGITSKCVRSADQIRIDDAGNDRAAARGPQRVPVRRAAAGRDVGDVLRALVAARLDQPAATVDPAAGFFALGLQSSQLLAVVGDIERSFGLELSPTLLFEHGTLEEVGRYVAGELARRAPALPVAAQGIDYGFAAADALLADHRVQGRPALMGIVHACLAADSALRGGASLPLALERVVFHGGPILPRPDETVRLAVDWSGAVGASEFRVERVPGDALHCAGKAAAVTAATTDTIDLDALWAAAVPLQAHELERIYGAVHDFEIGATLRTIDRAARQAPSTLICRVRLDAGRPCAPDGRAYALDPVLLAACYFLDGAVEPALADGAALVPLAIERLELLAELTSELVIVNTVRVRRDGFVAFDATVYDTRGACVVRIRNASLSTVREPATLFAAAADAAVVPSARAVGSAVPIAIIGLSGRYPQAVDVDAFWRNLAAGRDCVTEIPADRWDWREFYAPDGPEPGRIASRWGGFIDGVDQFAPLFFGIAPRDAAFIDPQERLFLEECWNALEDAGYTRAAFGAGPVGVYAGVMSQEYALYAIEPTAGNRRVGVASGTGSIANRVSYSFDFRGPSLTVDTMCSSSLTAIALACDALRDGRIDGALAGGVNVSVHPNKYLMLGQGGFLSSKGQCGSFGSGSGGYVPGEGVGVVVLKRLDDAERDHDQIHGVIRGIAVNHGGRASGYAVPNPRAQHEVIRSAWRESGVDPRRITYVEAHGTGTLLGDPIEIEGLTRAFRETTPARGFCAIGSVKSNVGHCESAAGIAALTKVLLQLRHGELVPSLHCDVLNPNIDFDATPFVVQRHRAPWARPPAGDDSRVTAPRAAGVSSFGAGGTNAHLVVEEYVAGRRASARAGTVLVVLSAKTAAELLAMAGRLLHALESGRYADDDLDRIAYTLQTGREAMEERLAVVADSIDGVRRQLADWIAGSATSGCVRARAGSDAAFSPFVDDDDLDATVAAWFSQGKLAKVAHWWAHGATIDWSVLYPRAHPRRIGLPTYPFTRQRCWLGDTPVARPPAPVAGAPTAAAAQVFAETWVPRAAGPLPAVRAGEAPVCLVFASKAVHRAACAAAIAQVWPLAQVVFVAQARDVEAVGDVTHIVACDDPAGFDAVFASLRGSLNKVDFAFHLWALDDAASVVDAAPLMQSLQALARSAIPTGRFIAAGSAAAGSLDACHLETHEALVRSARHALPGTQLASVFDDGSATLAERMRVLVDEARGERLLSIRYRDGQRLAREFRVLSLARGEAAAVPYKAGGTYLITGGFGGLGSLVARHLARTLNAHLVLVGRSALDARRRALVAELEAAGATVTCLVCDVGDAPSLRAALAAARPALGPIHGVVHAAGVAGDAALVDKSLQEFHDVLAPKIAGTLALDTVMADEPLDFFCCFSSVAAVLGDFGGGDYAGGNRFQHAYADWRRRSGRPGRSVAIDWPLWRDGGLAFGDDAAQTQYLQASGQQWLETDAALALLPRLFGLDVANPIVLVGERERLASLLAGVPATPRRGGSDRETAAPAATADPGALTRRVEQDLKIAIGTLLHIAVDDVRRSVNLADFGFDSVSLQAFAAELAARYRIEVTPATFFDYPTVERLAAYFVAAHGGAMAAVLETTPSVTVPPVSTAAAPPPASRTASLPPASDATVPTIAVIGMSGRFPRARDIAEMWALLASGTDAIEEIPAERFDWRPYYAPGAAVAGKTNAKWSGIVPGAGEFDALFFEISPREAEQIDPRQRLLLQEAYRALEDAGYGPAQIAAGRIGVFVGAETGAYGGLDAEKETITANHEAVLAARLSYFLDLSGPAMAINTACSSGLVALHQACLQLRAGECDTAIAAGVNLLLAPESFVGMSQTGMLSPDGRCFTFDRRANGMVPGEAIVALVVKRLADALADGDAIHALIRGIGINHDGRTNGLTAPSGLAQQRLLTGVYEAARVDPADIDHVIAHGTATQLGDQIELRALRDTFAARGDTQRRHCALTSTKSNFGHTFAASGLVSVVAMIAAMRHALIPRSLHCEEPADFVRWDDSPFFVNRANRPWPATPGKPRLGAVSAFGMSGTNAHVVIESHDAVAPRIERAWHLIALSGRDDEALRRRAAELAAWLVAAGTTVDLAAVSHTLLARRRHHRHRQAFVVATVEAAIEMLGTAPQPRDGAVVPRDFVPDAAAQARVERLAAHCATLDPPRLHDALRELATAYCAGHDPDWRRLWGAAAPPSVHLPAYPFERRHYWRERLAAAPAAVPLASPATAPAAVTATPGTVQDAAVASTQGEHIVALVLDHLGLTRGEITDDAPLDEFGLDSIGAAKLVTAIRERLPDAVGSLFLEYNTLAGLRRYGDTLAETLVGAMPARAAVAAAPAPERSAPGIVLVGLAGLFPGATTLAGFWDNLRAGSVVTGTLPARRRALLRLGPEAPPNHGGYVDDVECFDHERFKLSRDEARAADPQLRKLMEVTWQAIADAGYTVAEFKKSATGVFVATAGHSGYREIPGYRVPGAGLPAGETAALYAGRLSNLFDLKGPSAVVDAGCASFLVALENACAAIEAGRCDQAVVATAQLYLSPYALTVQDHGVLYSKGTTTRSFARDSDGYVRSEVVGVAIIKRGALADRDRDAVYCRLLGAGVFHGGKAPLKWYSPNVKGQRAAIRAALDHAGISGSSIGYVETEANGSQLGDASEIVAIQSEYRRTPDEAQGITRFGSLKPLCGHAEAAATFPAFAKIVLSLVHRQLLGVVDPGALNEGITLKPGFEILTTAQAWPDGATPRRGAVHSLSVGGVNAHVVLEEHTALVEPETGVAQVFVYSARTPDLLRASVAAHAAFLARAGDAAPALHAIACTLQTGRDAEAQRLAIVAGSAAELATLLSAWLDDGAPVAAVRSAPDAPADLLAQAQAWAAGRAVDWRAASVTPLPRRVHLPAPALAQEMHWHAGVVDEVPLPVAGSRADAGVGAVLLRPKWTAQPLPAPAAAPAANAVARRTVFCGWSPAQIDGFVRHAGDDDVRSLALDTASPAEQFRACSTAVFDIVRERLATVPADRLSLLQLVIPAGLEHVGLHGLVGLLRTATREHSRFRGQLVVLARDTAAADGIAALRRLGSDCNTDYVQLRDNVAWTQSWEVVTAGQTQAEAAAPLQAIAGGKPVVLVTGGAGGIGLDLAERILEINALATVVLAGRSANPPQSERIARLQVRGARLHYAQADVGSAPDVEALVADVLRRHGRLNGIFHCAGVTRDSFIVRKGVDDVDAVLQPKVAGLCHLDEATRDIPLDFLVAFSSLSSMFGNPGQADYSMANAFMDAFAAYRNQLVCLNERSGRTLSINWPLWSGGGMTMSEEMQRYLEEELGWLPMPNRVGVDIALDLLRVGATQIAVKYGQMARLLDDNVHSGWV